MNKTTVVNIKTTPPDQWDVYIGRAMRFHKDPRVRVKSKYANPYGIKKYGRAQSLEKYRAMAEYCLCQGIWTIEDMRRDLEGKVIACWCVEKPINYTRSNKVCHGEVLIELLDKRKP